MDSDIDILQVSQSSRICSRAIVSVTYKKTQYSKEETVYEIKRKSLLLQVPDFYHLIYVTFVETLKTMLR